MSDAFNFKGNLQVYKNNYNFTHIKTNKIIMLSSIIQIDATLTTCESGGEYQ